MKKRYYIVRDDFSYKLTRNTDLVLQNGCWYCYDHIYTLCNSGIHNRARSLEMDKYEYRTIEVSDNPPKTGHFWMIPTLSFFWDICIFTRYGTNTNHVIASQSLKRELEDCFGVKRCFAYQV